jgi:hypothetical protein
MNIIELNEMIDLINRFFHETSHKMLMIGEMVGSHPLSHVVDAATEIVRFDEILILEGCADYCYIPKKPIFNYLPYPQIFTDQFLPNVEAYDPFQPHLWEPNQPIVKSINQEFLRRFQIVIVNNAHLIDPWILDQIAKMCKWKCIFIGDPFDIGGEPFMKMPTLVACLEKQSPIIGMARKLYGISTYAIDKKAPGNVTNGKVTRKGLGKLDGRIYVSNDAELVQLVQDQQRKQPFRKGQRFFVTDDRIHLIMDEQTKNIQHITKNALLIMGRMNSNSYLPQSYQIHHSKQTIRFDIQYDHVTHFPNEWDYRMRVKPANMLTLEDAKHHRYFNTIFVCHGDFSKRELYSVMKNSVNLTICSIKGEKK